MVYWRILASNVQAYMESRIEENNQISIRLYILKQRSRVRRGFETLDGFLLRSWAWKLSSWYYVFTQEIRSRGAKRQSWEHLRGQAFIVKMKDWLKAWKWWLGRIIRKKFFYFCIVSWKTIYGMISSYVSMMLFLVIYMTT